MSLPVSVLAPTPAPRLIDPGSYKTTLRLNVPGLNEEMENLVCGQAVNSLAMKATGSRLRTFTYNLMAKDNHKSNEFLNMCNYAGKYCVKEYVKEYVNRQNQETNPSVNLRNIILDKVPEAITLWMTTLLPKYKDMEYELGSSLYHKASKLNKLYQESLKEIDNMSFNPQALAALQALMAQQGGMSNGMQGLMPNQGLVNIVLNGQTYQVTMEQALQLKAMQQQQQAMQNPMGGNMLQQLLGVNQGHNAPQQPLNLMGTGTSNATAINLGGGTQTIAPVTTGNADLMREWRKSRGETVEEFAIGSPLKESSPQVVTLTDLGTNVTKEVREMEMTNIPSVAPVKKKDVPMFEIDNYSEQDFANAMIRYLGFPVLEQKTPRYEILRNAIIKLIKAEPENPYIFAKEEGTDEEIETRQCVVVNKSTLLYSSKGSMIHAAREFHHTQVKEFPDSFDDITVCFGTAVNPIYVNSEAAKGLIKRIIGNVKSVTSLAQNMEAFVPMFTELVGSTSDDRKKIQNETTYCDQIDQWLTDHVNEFCEYHLNGVVQIDNFASDYHDLEKYVASKGGAEALKALDRHMEAVLESMRLGNGEVVKEYLEDLTVESGIETYGLCETVMIASVPLSSSELGFKAGQPRAIVDMGRGAQLHSLMKALEKTAEDMEIIPIYKYITTRDGAIYSYRNAPLHGAGKSFFIERVKSI